MNPKTANEHMNSEYPEVFERMREFSAPYITAVAKAIAHDEGDFVGSGSFMVFGGQAFIVTAEHVATQAETGSSMGAAFSNGDGKLYQRIDPPFSKDVPLDIAISPVTLDRLGASTREACPSSRIALSAGAMDDLLFVHGFPQERSRTLKIIPGIRSITLPFLAYPAETTPKCKRFDPNIHFAMTFDHGNAQHADGTPATLPLPHGMSGSPVWNTRRRALGEKWQHTDARIVGVIHNWDQDARCIIGTKIEYVHGFAARLIAAAQEAPEKNKILQLRAVPRHCTEQPGTET